MWTAATRKNYNRKTARCQSDVTDKEWRVIEPHLPPARATCLAVAGDWHLLRHALQLRVAAITNEPSALEHGLSLVCHMGRSGRSRLFRIDFGFVGGVTAVAPSIDLHYPILYRPSFRYRQISDNNTRNAAIPDKHQIELVAKSPNDMGKQ